MEGSGDSLNSTAVDFSWRDGGKPWKLQSQGVMNGKWKYIPLNYGVWPVLHKNT
jgi:hypothetical protein